MPDCSLRFIIDPGNMPHEELFRGLTELAEWLENLRTGQRFLRIICLMDPAKVLALRCKSSGQRLVELPGVNLVTLRRWSEAAQRHWFNDINRPPADVEQPKRWVQRTGGWPVLTELVQKDFLDKRLADPDIQFNGEIMVDQMGLSLDAGLAVTFQVLSHLGSEVNVRDLAEFAAEEGVGSHQVPLYADVLLDLDLAIGTAESMRAEPFAAATFAEVSRR